MPITAEEQATPSAANDRGEPLDRVEWNKRGGLRCPHCRGQGSARSSEEVTITYRKIYYVCLNPACGHTWRASLAYEHGLSPSGIPDPKVDLPLRPMDRADVVKPDPPPDPDQFRFFD